MTSIRSLARRSAGLVAVSRHKLRSLARTIAYARQLRLRICRRWPWGRVYHGGQSFDRLRTNGISVPRRRPGSRSAGALFCFRQATAAAQRPGPRPSPGNKQGGSRIKSGMTSLMARHLTLSTCSNSSSTGVARPKIDTDTFTRPRSKSSSSTTPLKLANGPSRTLTLSPMS